MKELKIGIDYMEKTEIWREISEQINEDLIVESTTEGFVHCSLSMNAILGYENNYIFLAVPSNDQKHQDFSLPSWMEGTEIVIDGEKMICIRASVEHLGDMATLIVETVHRNLEGLNLLDALLHSLIELKKRWKSESEPLSRSKQIGLIGELFLLKKLYEHIGDKALECWTGSERTLHDFMCEPEWHIEVKTTTSDPPVVNISPPSQLDWDIDSKLGLAVVRLKSNPKEGQSLSETVEQIKQKFNSRSIYLFDTKLAAAGYTSSLRNKFKTKWTVYGISLHPISSESEILDPKISEKAPSSIRKIAYTLSTSNMPITTLEEFIGD